MKRMCSGRSPIRGHFLVVRECFLLDPGTAPPIPTAMSALSPRWHWLFAGISHTAELVFRWLKNSFPFFNYWHNIVIGVVWIGIGMGIRLATGTVAVLVLSAAFASAATTCSCVLGRNGGRIRSRTRTTGRERGRCRCTKRNFSKGLRRICVSMGL